MNNLAIIPARSGSKRLLDKNIKLLNGKPLMAYSIEAAKKSGLFKEIIVSTDSDKYAAIAQNWGANVPFLRSAKLSTDSASSWDVVRDVISRYQASGTDFDTVTLLQPTSPLRTAEEIIAAYNFMEYTKANSVIGVCEIDHPRLWINTLPENRSLSNFFSNNLHKAPTDSPDIFYRINGAIYIVKVAFLLSSNNIYADKSFAFIMPKETSIDIDDEADFLIAEALIKTKNQG